MVCQYTNIHVARHSPSPSPSSKFEVPGPVTTPFVLVRCAHILGARKCETNVRGERVRARASDSEQRDKWPLRVAQVAPVHGLSATTISHTPCVLRALSKSICYILKCPSPRPIPTPMPTPMPTPIPTPILLPGSILHSHSLSLCFGMQSRVALDPASAKLPLPTRGGSDLVIMTYGPIDASDVAPGQR